MPLNAPNHLVVEPVQSNTQVQRQAFELQGRYLTAGEHIEVLLEKNQAPADGHTALPLRILVRDADGRPITAPIKVAVDTSLGRLRLADGRLASSTHLVVVNGQEDLELVASSTAGSNAIRVSSGPVNAVGSMDFLAQLRPLFGLGIADISHTLTRSQHEDQVIAKTGFEDNFHQWDGPNQSGVVYQNTSSRAAGFIKGTIFQDYVLTSSYDSAKITQQKFFWDVDPNDYYPIYGDTSVVRYDARSTGKLYLRIDQQKNYFLYGDFLSHDSAQPLRLGSYARTLTGARAHYENETVAATAFAAKTSRTTMVDEQPGRGLSGPYAVSRLNAVANSEQVSILVRDRLQPAVVRSRTPMVRHVDYEYEPFSGRILFREPVASVDEDFNPVSIRIVYEVEDGGPKYWVGGADGQLKLGPDLTVSGRHTKDDNPLTQKTLSGATADWQLGESTHIVLDAASSRGSDFIASGSLGTASNRGLAAGGGSILALPSGQALRAELNHDSGPFKVSGFAARTDVGFDNASAGINPGRKEALLKSEYAIAENLTAVASGRFSQDLITPGEQVLLSAGLRRAVTPRLRLGVGVNKVRDDYPAGASPLGSLGSAALPGAVAPGGLHSTSFGAGDFQYGPFSNLLGSSCVGLPQCDIVHRYTSVYADARYELTDRWSLTGVAEQAVDGDHGWRLGVGTEYRFRDAGRLYGRYEWVDGLLANYGFGDDLKSSHRLVFGADTAYMPGGNVFEELRLAEGSDGHDAVNAVGVRNVFHLNEHLVANTSVENQVLVQTDTGNRNAQAVAGGLEYSGSPLWRIGGRLEYRISDTQKTWLSSASAVRRLNQDWSVLARNLLLSSQGRDTAAGQDHTQDRLQLGLAWRDTGSNRLNAIGRYEHNIDHNTGPDSPDNYRNDVLALAANYRPARDWTLSASGAFKHQVDRFDGPGSSFNGKLVSARVIHDLNERWDLGLIGSHSWGGPTQENGVGVEVGLRVMTNLWLSAGYVAGSYADSELYSTNSHWRALYLRLRFKFDENLFKP
ncbi:hypothetical protein GT347_04345 [Xylophilus rhododendri]|uniref:Uncharacterized protein n=1 Tax=Xylophilus rhododendri TaxID=2697032 RepID=A0A857J0N0_9BURK|nr:hypothetical protein [Xylophilus rhododendri]QHI97276.1 hypothetical protein GT347_04345 [Xylophilus rhododendri]